MGTHRNMYYVNNSMLNLAEMQSRAIFLSSGPNTDTITIHMHSSIVACENQEHKTYPSKGEK